MINTISTPCYSGTTAGEGEVGTAFAVIVGGITVVSFFGARARLTGVLQVSGNTMGPAVAHRGSVDVSLRNLDSGCRTIGVVGARGFGAGAGGT